MCVEGRMSGGMEAEEVGVVHLCPRISGGEMGVEMEGGEGGEGG